LTTIFSSLTGNALRHNFLWAHSVLSSRAFPFGSVNSQSNDNNNNNNHGDISKSEFSLSSDGNTPQQSVSDFKRCQISLWPVIDMMNHRRNERVTWESNTHGVQFKSEKAIFQGSEIFNNYGNKGNEVLIKKKKFQYF